MSWPARIVAIALTVLLASHPAHAVSERIMFVLDGSGSMWGQIDGINKIVTAREVMRNLIDDLGDDIEVGLISYGHRSKGDCGDIETIVPLGPLDRAGLKAAVEGIMPKGKTPLSAAVIQAAEQLKYTEEQATVVLVSDGRETCDMDPCAVGTQLERTGVDFTTHVIGFDVAAPEDRTQLQCLAENTGGRFLTASNAQELTVALREVAAVALAPPTGPVARAPEPAPAPRQETVKIKKIQKTETGNLAFNWPRSDNWVVYRGEQTEDNRVGVYNGTDTVALQAGRYVVAPQYGAAFEPFEIEVAAGETVETDASAGLFEFRWPGHDNWEVHRGEPSRENRVGTYNGTDTVALQAGRYVVAPQYGAAFEPFEIEVAAGETVETDASAGLFEFRWPGHDNWEVHRGEPSRENRVGTYNGTDTVALQAGRYVVTPQYGAAFEPFEIEVAAGQRLIAE